jgi:oxygen-dependent protoporphyrinogen oxidase
MPDADLVVLEAAQRPGGVIGTQRKAGFLFEEGPGGWLDRDPSTRALLSALQLEAAVIEGNEGSKRRFVQRDGKLHLFPTGPRSLFSSDLLTFKEKARIFMEPFISWDPTAEDRTVAAFFERRIGRAAMRAFVDPVIAGIYASRPEDLSLAATLPAVAQLARARKSLLGLALAGRKGIATRYATLAPGMGAFIDALADSLGGRLQTGAPVEALARDGHQWRVTVGGEDAREIQADCVVITTPARVSERLVSGLDEDIDAFFARVPTVPVAVVGLGYSPETAPELPGYGHLLPSDEPGPVLGVLWSSSIFAGRAERGAALRVILGGWRHPAIHTLDDDRLLALSREAVATALGATSAPQATSVARHPQGLPQYGVGHLDRLAAMERACRRQSGLFIAGNATRGVGVNACTATAALFADQVVDYCESLF